ncbi:MAG: hypothetical protein AAGJ19_00620 [Myxococcota bacterium]
MCSRPVGLPWVGEPGFFYLQGWEMLAVFWVFTVLLVSLPRQLVIWQRDLNGANQLFRFPACPRPPWRGPTASGRPFGLLGPWGPSNSLRSWSTRTADDSTRN